MTGWRQVVRAFRRPSKLIVYVEIALVAPAVPLLARLKLPRLATLLGRGRAASTPASARIDDLVASVARGPSVRGGAYPADVHEPRAGPVPFSAPSGARCPTVLRCGIPAGGIRGGLLVGPRGKSPSWSPVTRASGSPSSIECQRSKISARCGLTRAAEIEAAVLPLQTHAFHGLTIAIAADASRCAARTSGFF